MTQPKVKDLLPIPELMEMRRVLCVQAHPDDGEIGAGATVAKLTRAGADVIYLTITDGGVGTEDVSITPAELARIRRGGVRAASLLSVNEMIRRFPDGSCLGWRLCVKVIKRSGFPKAIMVMDLAALRPIQPPDYRTGGGEAAMLGLFPHVCAASGRSGDYPSRPSLCGTSRQYLYRYCRAAAAEIRRSQNIRPVSGKPGDDRRLSHGKSI